MSAAEHISSLGESGASLLDRASWALPAGLLGLALGAWIALLLAARVGRRKRHHVAVRRAARAKRGEDAGEDLLLAAGYEVVARQATLAARWHVDDEALDYTLRADWLVERDGARWVADAKTGDWARSVNTRATRRQMLEYIVQYDVEGALLVDTEAGRIHELRFEGLSRADQVRPASSPPLPVTVLFAVALAWVCWRILSAFAA